MKVAVYGMTKVGVRGGRGERGDVIGLAMAEGMRKHGVEVTFHTSFDGVVADVALAYGWINELQDKVFSSYVVAGSRYVFLDLGYWDRGARGYYRVSVDDWDSATNMLRDLPDDRFTASGIKFRDDWNPESPNVMIVGMSDKAAWTHGYKYNEWERATVAYLEDKYKGRGLRFIIRQKPRGKEAKSDVPIEKALKDVRFVISHHSNVGVDCLVAGVPYTCKKGVAKHLAPITDPNNFVADAPILDPFFPTNAEKRQLLNDIAYVQWSIAEMKAGACWAYVQEILSK